MKLHKYLFMVMIVTICGYHTATHGFLKELKFWDSGREEIVSLTQQVPNDCVIKVKNYRGNISVKTWKKNKIVIEARKKGSEKALHNTKVSKYLSGKLVTIETVYDLPNINCNVHYDILVPETAKLKSLTTDKGNISINNAHQGIMAKTEKGTITIENGSGEIQTSSTKGSINISTTKLLPEDKILAISGKGHIKLTIPQDTNADLLAKTTRGLVKSEHAITTKSKTMKFNTTTLAQLKKEVEGTIGKGGASIKLHTSGGNIALLES